MTLMKKYLIKYIYSIYSTNSNVLFVRFADVDSLFRCIKDLWL